MRSAQPKQGSDTVQAADDGSSVEATSRVCDDKRTEVT